MSRLLADENFPRQTVEELRRLGRDVVTLQQVLQSSHKSLPDPNVLALASEDSRAVLTFNRKHFKSLHEKHPNHHGIVSCTEDRNHVALAHRIHSALREAPDPSRQLIQIYRPNLQAKPLTSEHQPSLAQTTPAKTQSEKAAAETKACAEHLARLKTQQRAAMRDKGRSHER